MHRSRSSAPRSKRAGDTSAPPSAQHVARCARVRGAVRRRRRAGARRRCASGRGRARRLRRGAGLALPSAPARGSRRTSRCAARREVLHAVPAQGPAWERRRVRSAPRSGSAAGWLSLAGARRPRDRVGPGAAARVQTQTITLSQARGRVPESRIRDARGRPVRVRARGRGRRPARRSTCASTTRLGAPRWTRTSWSS